QGGRPNIIFRRDFDAETSGRATMSKEDPRDIVRLANAANVAEAHILKQALEDEGISCQVMGEYQEAFVGDIPGMYPEVWVHRDDLAGAEEVLRRRREEAKEEEVDESSEKSEE